jgi:predicted ATPase
MVRTYTSLGYELVAIPRAPITDRLEFVIARVAEAGAL